MQLSASFSTYDQTKQGKGRTAQESHKGFVK